MNRSQNRVRNVFVESLENRRLLSGSNLGEVLVPMSLKGTLADTGSSDTYQIKLEHPGWISAVPFKVTNAGATSLGIVLTGDGVEETGWSINQIAKETAQNELDAGDYTVAVTRQDASWFKGKPMPVDYNLVLWSAYAGQSFALAQEVGPLSTAQTFKGYVGTVPDVVAEGSENYEFTTGSTSLITASVNKGSNDGVVIWQERNGVWHNQFGGQLSRTVEVAAGTFYVQVVNLTGLSAGFTLSVSQAPVTIVPSFSWAMADRYGVDTNKNGLVDLPNSAAYANPNGFLVSFDPTSSLSSVPVTSSWTVSGGGLRAPESFGGTKLNVYLPQGTYTMTLKLKDPIGLITTTQQSVKVRDYLIVALGDSYGSGEGNPEVANSDPQKVKWADGVSAGMTKENFEAHRSTLAYSSVAAMQLEHSDPHTSVTYINLCISGATIDAGMLGTTPGLTNESYTLKAEVPELLSIIGARKIDSLFLSIGGNDFGFSGYIIDLLASDAFGLPTEGWIDSRVDTALTKMQAGYKQLASALDSFSIGKTYITGYPDITQIAPGDFVKFATDVIPSFGFIGISAESAEYASDHLLAPLNQAVKTAAGDYGWDYVDDYANDFLSHGYAASTPWFRTMTVAENLQGKDNPVLGTLFAISDGGFHPNTFAHADEAKYVLSDLKAQLG